jgi:hypothetical protein
VERGRGILKRVGRLNQRPSAEQPEGVEQEPAESREPERGNPPAETEHGEERIEEAERARREIGERKVQEAEDRTSAQAEPRFQEQDESFKQKFAEAERRLEEAEARVQAAEQLAARAERVAALHASEPGQLRRTKEEEPQDDGQSSPDAEPPKQPERAAEAGDGINLQTAPLEQRRELVVVRLVEVVEDGLKQKLVV